MQRGFSKRHLKRLAQKEYQKMTQACSLSGNANDAEEILGSTDFSTERVGDFQVIYDDNFQIKQENENIDCQTSATTEEEETTTGSYFTSRRIDDFRIINENSVHINHEGENRNSLGQMEYLVKKTIDDCFVKMENKMKDYVDSKVSIIIKTQGEISAMLKQIIKKHVSLPSEVVFPIQTEEQLRTVNDRMQQDSDLHITTLRTLLLPGGIKKNLQNVMDLNLLSDFNVDGILGKKSFKEYAAFVNGIYRAVQCDGMTETAFITDLRNAFKLNKNKFFKTQSRLKKKKKNQSSNGGTACTEPRPKFNIADLHKLKKMKFNGANPVNTDSSTENSPPIKCSEGDS